MENPIEHRITVSIVIAFYNAEKYLRETVESVLSQCYQEWELLLVDDGSTDASSAMARSYAEKYPEKIRYFEHPGHQNLGAPTTRNLGFRLARGNYIAPLDADDVWLPNKLSDQMAILKKYPTAGMICGAVEHWWSWDPKRPADSKDAIFYTGGPQDALVEPPKLFEHIYPLQTGMAPTPSDIVFKKEVFERIGGFEEEFHHQFQLYDDQSFLNKVYLFFPVYISSQVWIKYRRHSESCVSTVLESGQYHQVRKFFLRWFKKYLKEHGFKGTEIWRMLEKAQMPYRHPLIQKWHAIKTGTKEKR